MSPREWAYEGIITATPTPLDQDGNLNEAAVRALVSNQIDSGVRGLAPTGGTGEFTALTADQRRKMVGLTVAAANNRVPVIAGVLSPGLGDAIATARDFIDEGATALMVVTPYYARPTQQGIVDYYKRISDEATIDLVLYDIPYRTGIALEPDTVVRLVDSTRVVAMKACNQDLVQQSRMLEAVGDKIAILSGEEDVFPQHIAMGARGGILATSCLFPKLWNEVFVLARQGATESATSLHAEMRPGIDALFAEHNPGPLKAALALIGQSAGSVLPPLRNVSDALLGRLKTVLPPLLSREKSTALRPAA